MKQKQSGSGLIFAVVLLFVILGMVITLSSVTVLETKMSQKTKSSVGAFYNSESGVEWALNQIATKTGPNISDIFGASFSGGKVTCPSGFGCELYLLDDQGKVIASNLTIDQVKAVRSMGTQSAGGAVDTQRTIEAAVATSSIQFSTIDNTSSSCDTACTAKGEKCAAGYLLDRNFGGGGGIVVMRSIMPCSGSPGGGYSNQCLCYK